MKISAELDLTKLDKTKIVEKKYKDKDGKEITQKIYKFDVVPLKEPKFVTEGEGWKMLKTHFLADPQTKEEREQKKSSNYIGSGFTFERGEKQPTFNELAEDAGIPF